MKVTFKIWMRLSILLIATAISGVSFGQANFLSVFGYAGSPGSCPLTNRFNCTIGPSSASCFGEPNLIDLAPSMTPYRFQNAVYSSTGQLLFSVKQDGIYASDAGGTEIYSFNGPSGMVYYGTGSSTPLPCGGSTYPAITKINSLSEIVCFPVPGQCNSYYVCYWAEATGDLRGPGYAWLTAIQVTLTSSFGNPAAPVSSWYTCTPNFITQPVCSGGSYTPPYYPYFGSASSGEFEIVADAPNPDGSRDLYTIHTWGTIIGGAFTSLYSILSQWHISPTGALPINSPTVISTYLPVSFSTKAKLFNVNGDKVFAYVGIPYATSANGYEMVTYDLATGYIYHYAAPVASGSTAGQQTICGFEYLPSAGGSGLYCFSYVDDALGSTSGGLGYTPPLTTISGSSTNFTGPIPSTAPYNTSDLELDKNGDMILGNANGTVSYIPSSGLSTSSFTTSSSVSTLNYGSGACTGATHIPLFNIMAVDFSVLSGIDLYYLGSQIRGDDYNWSPDVASGYVIPTGSTVTWTPTSNPVHDALYGVGSSTPLSTINVNGIVIQAGATLYINNMTVRMQPGASITVSVSPTPAGSGGWLTLNNTTLTAGSNCSSSSTTWAGITVLGNPSYTQTLGGFGGPQSQGVLYMNGCTISYAEVGVQNGRDATTSGGIINSSGLAYNTFYNNHIESVQLWPYRNYVGGVEANSIENFNGTTFENTAPTGGLIGSQVVASDIRGVDFRNCNFLNFTGSPMYAGINALNVGLILSGNTFKNFMSGASNLTITGTYTTMATSNTFTNNKWGLVLEGGVAPWVNGNTFNIPAYSGPTPVYYPGTTSMYIVNYQNIGAYFNATTPYLISQNVFNGAASGYNPNTTGTLEYNTGSRNNQVTDNTFSGLGVAMNSNFTNNSSEDGLQYLCNTDTRNEYDIAILGWLSGLGGINPTQATSSGTGTFDLSAGNTFSTGSGVPNINNRQLNIVYNYNSSAEYPTVNSTTKVVRIHTSPAHCYVVSTGGSSSYASSGSYALGSYSESGPNDAALSYAVAAANLNYYMIDTDTISHRDSVYYWAAQLNSPYGDLLTANMLIEDSLIDSADTVYDHIIPKFSLTGPEANDFVQGRSLMDLLIAKRTGDRNLFNISASQISTLRSVKANATMWAHARAEAWLLATAGDTLTDTLLYPVDTTIDSSGNRFSHPVTAIATTANNTVFPNPVHDYLQVMYTAKSSEPLTIEIEDISGRTLIVQQLQSGMQSQVNMNSLASGIYIYRIFEGSKVAMIGKIAKD